MSSSTVIRQGIFSVSIATLVAATSLGLAGTASAAEGSVGPLTYQTGAPAQVRCTTSNGRTYCIDAPDAEAQRQAQAQALAQRQAQLAAAQRQAQAQRVQRQAELTVQRQAQAQRQAQQVQRQAQQVQAQRQAQAQNLSQCPLLLEGMSSGPCVAAMQWKLDSDNPNYHLKTDGIFGADTRIALLDFQGRHHLPADGNAGPATLTALQNSTGTPVVKAPVVKAPVVKAPEATVPEATVPESAPSGHSTSGAGICKGAGSIANNIVGFVAGMTYPPILFNAQLGVPRKEGNVVRADGSVQFKSWGSCMATVAFQMQTKVCHWWGCGWETRNHGTDEYLWKHDDTGEVHATEGMTCRKGTNTYRMHMAVVGPASDGVEPNKKGKGGAIGEDGAASSDESEDGPEIKLDC